MLLVVPKAGPTVTRMRSGLVPWNKQVEKKGVSKGGTLTVMADENGGSVT
jgi:hypothetical protein